MSEVYSKKRLMTGQSERKRKYYSHPVTIEKRKVKKEEEEEREERDGERRGGRGRKKMHSVMTKKFHAASASPTVT